MEVNLGNNVVIKQEIPETAETTFGQGDSLIPPHPDIKIEMEEHDPDVNVEQYEPDSLKIITNLCKNIQAAMNSKTSTAVCNQTAAKLKAPRKQARRSPKSTEKTPPHRKQKENSVAQKEKTRRIWKAKLVEPQTSEPVFLDVVSIQTQETESVPIKEEPEWNKNCGTDSNPLEVDVAATEVKQESTNVDKPAEAELMDVLSLLVVAKPERRKYSRKKSVPPAAKKEMKKSADTTRKKRPRKEDVAVHVPVLNRSTDTTRRRSSRTRNASVAALKRSVPITRSRRKPREHKADLSELTESVPKRRSKRKLKTEEDEADNSKNKENKADDNKRQAETQDQQTHKQENVGVTESDPQAQGNDDMMQTGDVAMQATDFDTQNDDANTQDEFTPQKSGESDSEESDGLKEFLDAVEPKPKPRKYKPRRKRILTPEQIAEREKRSLEKRTCPYCSAVFAFPGGLKNHVRSKHTFEKPFTCEICDERFSIQSSYYLHKRRHLGIKPFLCNQCGKTFLRRIDMHIHMRSHTPLQEKIRDVKCSMCPNVYTSKLNLRKHVLSKHTDPSEWKHVCCICGKRHFAATELSHHIRQHNDDRSFKCMICERGFFTKQSLNIHLRTHSANTRFNCEHCFNGYRSNEALQRHLLKVHGIGEEKPVTSPSYFCPICNEGFRQRARLDQHVTLHETGEEEYPFECTECHKRYKARNYFSIHMMDKHGIHIDESYFKERLQLLNPHRMLPFGESLSMETEAFDYSSAHATEDIEYKNLPGVPEVKEDDDNKT